MRAVNSPTFWQTEQWTQLCQSKEQERLPHALLFVGQQGLGKAQLAKEFGRYVLCPESKGGHKACGACKSCLLFKAGTHPDWQEITLEDSQTIKIEQVRNAIQKAQQTAQQAHAKVFVIHPAQALSREAQNALLKILEESPTNTYWLLVTNQVAKILPTIRSRCRIVRFTAPGLPEAIEWIQAQGTYDTEQVSSCLGSVDGAPLKALSWLQEEHFKSWEKWCQVFDQLLENKAEPVAVAEQLKNSDPIEALDQIYQHVSMKYRQQIMSPKDHIHWVESKRILSFLKDVLKVKQQLFAGFRLNMPLVYDTLMFKATKTRVERHGRAA